MTRYSNTHLTNCYIPLPLPNNVGVLDFGNIKKEGKGIQQVGKREDGREVHKLRQLYIERSVISPGSGGTAGSCLVELGHTKVLCEIIGPTTTNLPSNINVNLEEGTLHCDVKYASNFGFPMDSLVTTSVSQLDANSNNNNSSTQQQQQTSSLSMGKISSMINSQERSLSSRLFSALSSAVPLKDYPKNVIIIKITILQDDGSVLSACITAATLALIDAGIEVNDLVTSSTVAVISDNNNKVLLLADPTENEIKQAQAVVILSILPNYKQVTLWEQSGKLTSETANQAIELCRDGCRTMHRFMRQKFFITKM